MSSVAEERHAGSPSIYDALFSPLDEATRRRYAIGPDVPGDPAGAGPSSSAKRRPDRADAGDRPVEAGSREAGSAPQTPWDLGRAEWFLVAKRTVSETSEDRVTSVAGGVVFFGLLALFPALTALVSLYGVVADRATILGHLALLKNFLPAGAFEIIAGQIEAITAAPQTALSMAGIFALLMALYSATGGMKAMIDALNIAFFTVESRGFIKRNLIAIGFTLGAIVLIITMIGVIAVIPAIIRFFPLGALTEWAVAILRWPLMLVVLVLTLAALYRWGPNRDPGEAQWQWVLPGAVLAAVGLVVASMLFSWYVANFGNYNETYGSLGAVVGLMMWLWIAAIVVMVGGELNSEVERFLRRANGLPVPGE